MNELEGPVLAEVFGRLETQPEADAGRLEDAADLLEPPLVELEVLVVGPRVARRRKRGHAAQAARVDGRLGVFGQFLHVLGELLVVAFPIEGKGERAQLQSHLQRRAIEQPPGVGHALEPSKRGELGDVQVDARKAEGEGQLDDFALVSRDAQRGRVEVFEHGK